MMGAEAGQESDEESNRFRQVSPSTLNSPLKVKLAGTRENPTLALSTTKKSVVRKLNVGARGMTK
jgi:hypothetical protein